MGLYTELFYAIIPACFLLFAVLLSLHFYHSNKILFLRTYVLTDVTSITLMEMMYVLCITTLLTAVDGVLCCFDGAASPLQDTICVSGYNLFPYTSDKLLQQQQKLT